jgi:hypothetical protein
MNQFYFSFAAMTPFGTAHTAPFATDSLTVNTSVCNYPDDSKRGVSVRRARLTTTRDKESIRSACMRYYQDQNEGAPLSRPRAEFTIEHLEFDAMSTAFGLSDLMALTALIVLALCFHQPIHALPASRSPTLR